MGPLPLNSNSAENVAAHLKLVSPKQSGLPEAKWAPFHFFPAIIQTAPLHIWTLAMNSPQMAPSSSSQRNHLQRISKDHCPSLNPWVRNCFFLFDLFHKIARNHEIDQGNWLVFGMGGIGKIRVNCRCLSSQIGNQAFWGLSTNAQHYTWVTVALSFYRRLCLSYEGLRWIWAQAVLSLLYTMLIKFFCLYDADMELIDVVQKTIL